MTDIDAPVSGMGRPRSADVHRRVVIAATSLFGQLGWGGVSVDAIARESGVSKRSIYLRWSNKEEVLSEALNEQLGVIGDIDSGSLRDDLRALARQIIELYTGPTGPAALRLAFEVGDDTATMREELRQSQIRAARALVHRATRSGELPAGTSAVLLLDTICGAALSHVINSPTAHRARIRRDARKYADELVEFVMGGLTA